MHGNSNIYIKKLYNTLYYCQCSTCFRQFLRPSSGAQNCIHNIGYLSSFYWFLPLAWEMYKRLIHHCTLCTVANWQINVSKKDVPTWCKQDYTPTPRDHSLNTYGITPHAAVKQPIYKNSWRWTCKCPKHVEAIYEKKIILKLFASSWYIFLTYIYDARSHLHQMWYRLSRGWEQLCCRA